MKKELRVITPKRSSHKVRKDIRRAVKSAQKKVRQRRERAHKEAFLTRVKMALRLILGKPI